jgi:hypothetical protein
MHQQNAFVETNYLPGCSETDDISRSDFGVKTGAWMG